MKSYVLNTLFVIGFIGATYVGFSFVALIFYVLAPEGTNHPGMILVWASHYWYLIVITAPLSLLYFNHRVRYGWLIDWITFKLFGETTFPEKLEEFKTGE